MSKVVKKIVLLIKKLRKQSLNNELILYCYE